MTSHATRLNTASADSSHSIRRITRPLFIALALVSATQLITTPDFREALAAYAAVH